MACTYPLTSFPSSLVLPSCRCSPCSVGLDISLGFGPSHADRRVRQCDRPPHPSRPHQSVRMDAECPLRACRWSVVRLMRRRLSPAGRRPIHPGASSGAPRWTPTPSEVNLMVDTIRVASRPSGARRAGMPVRAGDSRQAHRIRLAARTPGEWAGPEGPRARRTCRLAKGQCAYLPVCADPTRLGVCTRSFLPLHCIAQSSSPPQPSAHPLPLPSPCRTIWS